MAEILSELCETLQYDDFVSVLPRVTTSLPAVRSHTAEVVAARVDNVQHHAENIRVSAGDQEISEASKTVPPLTLKENVASSSNEISSQGNTRVSDSNIKENISPKVLVGITSKVVKEEYGDLVKKSHARALTEHVNNTLVSYADAVLAKM